MSEITSITVIDNVNLQQVAQTMQKISQFQAVVQGTLKKDHDFGIIPGTAKPTLLKPGAEKILMLMGLTSEYEVIEKVQDYERGFFAFTVKCTVSRQGLKITEGVGHANTREGRYANRWVTEKKLPEGVDKETLKKREKEGKYGKYFEYQVGNDDPYTLANTVLKMAKKRAQIDAVLTVASLSEIFTQDAEDLPPGFLQQDQSQQPHQQQTKPQKQPPKPASNGGELASEAQRKKIFAMTRGLGIEPETVKQIMADRYGLSDSKALTKKQATDLIEYFNRLENGEETWPPAEMFNGQEQANTEFPE